MQKILECELIMRIKLMNCFVRLCVVLESSLALWNMLRVLISECVEARSVKLAEKIFDNVFVAKV